LIPQGILRRDGHIRAAYVEQSVCFQHALQAVRFPKGSEARAKLLTAVLNSKLAAWYFFHTSANLGADRAKLHEEQLLDLPFPEPSDLSESAEALAAQEEIVSIVDELLLRKDEILLGENWMEAYANRANDLVFQFYGLTADERTLIEDGVNEIIPSMQPRQGKMTRLMRESNASTRGKYVEALVANLNRWMRPGVYVSAVLLEGAAESTMLELKLSAKVVPIRVDVQRRRLESSLRRVVGWLSQAMSHNIELQPDLKVFIEDRLYVVKPRSSRYWLLSSALNDADEIVGDLLSEKSSVEQVKAGQ
jgi:hypothetical protein